MTRTRRSVLALSIAAAALGCAATASAASDSAVSSNWAGYAVTPTSSSTTFRSVSGSWTVPTGSCDGSRGYSASWVGLGGYAASSQAPEQTGTEFDCNAEGNAVYSAWYELVPAPGRDIRMTVRPGDAMDASVTVKGTHVQIVLRNRTRHQTFKRVFTMSRPDTSSAEWIVEAPANCDSTGTQCVQLPVSNFGTEKFFHAAATTSSGHRGTISDSRWSSTSIELSQQRGFGRRRFAQYATSGGATPTELSTDGSSFSVAYSESAPSTGDQTPVSFPGGLPTG